MSEIQLVISRIAPQAVTDGGFVAALKRHLEERQRLDNLDVTLELEGDQPLNPAEQAALFRIAQEALNNVVKHARTSQATIRLHLTEPFWMEVEDHGAGFNAQQSRGGDQMGMASMSDRAAEINWALGVESSPGQGTCIRAEKNPGGDNY
jgi:signal transduction histidine kinase